MLELGILAAAGFSDLIGQSAVLFLNRVPPGRFLLCITGGVALFLASALTWASGVCLLGWFFGLSLSLTEAGRLVAYAHLPQLMGWLVFLPHFGAYLFHFLRGWVFFNLVVAIGVVTGTSLPVAVLCALPGWGLHFFVTHLGWAWDLAAWRRLSGRL